MHRHCRLLSLVGLGLLLSLPLSTSAQLSPGGAARPAGLEALAGPDAHFLRDDAGHLRSAYGMHLAVVGDDAPSRARKALELYGARFGALADALALGRVTQTSGLTVVRFHRQLDGLAVQARGAVVRLWPDGQVESIQARFGTAARALPDARLSVEQAQSVVRSDGLRFRELQLLGVRQAALDLGDRVARVFVIEAQDGERSSTRVEAYVDAHDGSLLLARPLVQEALGRVWDPNPVVADGMTSDVELQDLTSARFLTGRYVRVSSCSATGSSCSAAQRAMADSDGNFLFDPVDPSFDDPFAEVNVYFHVDRVARFFRDRLGFGWTCCGDTGVIEAIANYTETPGLAFENAFYSPASCGRGECPFLAMGQGMKDFGYDGDVIYHEYTHGVVDLVSSIVGFDIDPRRGVHYEPGAINEGTADYFSGSVTGDPEMAEYFTGLGGSFGAEGALRRLDNSMSCPNDLFGEVHADGNIWSGATWDVRGIVGPDEGDAIVFATLVDFPDNPDLTRAGETLLATAAAFEGMGRIDAGQLSAIQAAIETRGLVGCDREVPLDDGEIHRGYSGNDQITGSLGANVAPLHYRIDVPADATRLTLNIQKLTFAGRYGLYLRVGEPALFRSTRRPPLVADGEFPSTSEVVLDASSELPLPRCQTLYIGIISEDLTDVGQSIYQLQATLERSGDASATCPEPLMDAGVADADVALDAGLAEDAGSDAGADATASVGGGGGCGCRVSAASGGRPLLGLFGALALAGLLWRRRRA
ncbi:MAG: hypothetical protein GXP55_17740 [Deltaproteobacteria bacterium]|nr:hypothetical protein [Deltaproteobacteria bacterium]